MQTRAEILNYFNDYLVSALDGIVDSDDLSGDPITLSLNITDRGKMPVNDKGETKEFPKGGVAYCIITTALTEFVYALGGKFRALCA